MRHTIFEKRMNEKEHSHHRGKGKALGEYQVTEETKEAASWQPSCTQ